MSWGASMKTPRPIPPKLSPKNPRFDSAISISRFSPGKTSSTFSTVILSQSQSFGSVASNRDPSPLAFHFAQPFWHSDDMSWGASIRTPMLTPPKLIPKNPRFDSAISICRFSPGNFSSTFSTVTLSHSQSVGSVASNRDPSMLAFHSAQLL